MPRHILVNEPTDLAGLAAYCLSNLPVGRPESSSAQAAIQLPCVGQFGCYCWAAASITAVTGSSINHFTLRSSAASAAVNSLVLAGLLTPGVPAACGDRNKQQQRSQHTQLS